jgi:hypothetical protein
MIERDGRFDAQNAAGFASAASAEFAMQNPPEACKDRSVPDMQAADRPQVALSDEPASIPDPHSLPHAYHYDGKKSGTTSIELRKC